MHNFINQTVSDLNAMLDTGDKIKSNQQIIDTRCKTQCIKTLWTAYLARESSVCRRTWTQFNGVSVDRLTICSYCLLQWYVIQSVRNTTQYSFTCVLDLCFATLQHCNSLGITDTDPTVAFLHPSSAPGCKGPYTLTSFLVQVASASFWCQLPADE